MSSSSTTLPTSEGPGSISGAPKSTGTTAVNADMAVRPFRVDIAEEAVADLRRRIAAWRPPEREPVDDQSQGVQLVTVQDLANYWATEYDWRGCEAKLNALPQFVTEIDGLDVHFIHVRSPHQGALPLIVLHGWPGWIIEQLKIIEPLTNPIEHGRSADLLQRSRTRRPLRRLGTTATVFRRAARGVPHAALKEAPQVRLFRVESQDPRDRSVVLR